MGCAYLEGAHLSFAHLEGTDLRSAHLEGMDLRSAHLEGTDLREANPEGVNLETATFDENMRLPDGNQWTPETDLTRFTDPQHAAFWRSNHLVSPAYRGKDDSE